MILDTTQNISKIVLVCAMYVYGLWRKLITAFRIQICESSLGVIQVLDQSAAGLQDLVMKTIEEKGLNLKQCGRKVTIEPV